MTFGFSMRPYHRFVWYFVWKQSAKFHAKTFHFSREKLDFMKTCGTKNPNSACVLQRFSLKSHKIHVMKEFEVSCVWFHHFGTDFRCVKGLQTSKLLFVYVLPGVALVPDFRFLKYWLLRTGNKFSNPKWLLRSKQSSNHQITLTMD